MSDQPPSGPDPLLLAVDRFVQGARGRMDLLVQTIAQDALARVKELTPVRTGNLRAQWTIVTGSNSLELSGGRSESSAQAVLQLRAGDWFTIMNPAVYAARIEYGFVGTDSLGRHYDQKGAGMMTQTISELPKIALAAIARVGG